MAQWEQQLEEVVRTRRTALIGYACLFVTDRAEAEELVQDAVVRTFARARSWPDLASAEAYVRRAVRTSFLDGARRRTRGRDALRRIGRGAERRSPDDTATTGLDVRAALRALPARERACVVLRHIDDLTVADIAAELGLSDGAVKRYLSDGTRRLRERLGDAVALPGEPPAPDGLGSPDGTTVPVLPSATRSL